MRTGVGQLVAFVHKREEGPTTGLVQILLNESLEQVNTDVVYHVEFPAQKMRANTLQLDKNH